MNTRLMNNAKGWERILEMGFIEENDGTGDPRGIDYNMRKNGYHILIDPWFDVKMTYNDSDIIKLQVDDLIDLRDVIEFIEGGEKSNSVLHSISDNFSIYDEQLKKIGQISQTQIDLDHQLKILGNFARKLGLYDADSFLRNYH